MSLPWGTCTYSSHYNILCQYLAVQRIGQRHSNNTFLAGIPNYCVEILYTYMLSLTQWTWEFRNDAHYMAISYNHMYISPKSLMIGSIFLVKLEYVATLHSGEAIPTCDSYILSRVGLAGLGCLRSYTCIKIQSYCDRQGRHDIIWKKFCAKTLWKFFEEKDIHWQQHKISKKYPTVE